jgi:MYXO-CTERM domain-containing protein
VSAVFWSGNETAATALAEMADRSGPWPGIPNPPRYPIRLVIASDKRQFDSITAGRVPEWGAAASFPASNTIVLRLTPDHRRVLRHELAHLALHSIVQRVPRWFDEGYAARAAGEWDRLEALRVNWALLRGVRPSLGALDRHIREGGAAEAEVSYALATTAVLQLERMGGERGLEPLIEALGNTSDFDLAMRATYQLTAGQFEERWQRDLRQRYGWLLILSSLTVFWAFATLLLVALWARRRKRDEGRREALDEGWVVPEDPWDSTA